MHKRVKKDSVTFCQWWHNSSSGDSVQAIDRDEIAHQLEIYPQFIERLSEATELSYEAYKVDGNLCFAANNDELQNAFKLVFYPSDVLAYIYATFYSPEQLNSIGMDLYIALSSIPMPSDSDEFWKLVELGNSLLHIHERTHNDNHEGNLSVGFPGDNIIRKLNFRQSIDNISLKEGDGVLFFNQQQVIYPLPAKVWEYKVGAHRPAEEFFIDHINSTISNQLISSYAHILNKISDTLHIQEQLSR